MALDKEIEDLRKEHEVLAKSVAILTAKVAILERVAKPPVVTHVLKGIRG